MKYTLPIIIFSLLFFGCADKNAFSKFNMQKTQELSAANSQSSKVKTGENIDGIVSAIYLNKVYPNIYTVNEYFYVFLYLKDEKKMYNPNSTDDIKLTIKLNNKLPIKVEELSNENKFSYLASVKNEWQRYYLLAYKKDVNSTLNLALESGLSSSDKLVFQKDEQ
ncbi:hypothetical protein [Sulfurimonas sp.]|uniref:hypothetical protein n=1 Tax=Sulfurimonas sp. TaxID=2022749 RepID=UPI002AB1FF3F|nr:hypothetical protein [Sulfurimonas sp.]